jgi:hypothetical protein
MVSERVYKSFNMAEVEVDYRQKKVDVSYVEPPRPWLDNLIVGLVAWDVATFALVLCTLLAIIPLSLLNAPLTAHLFFLAMTLGPISIVLTGILYLHDRRDGFLRKRIILAEERSAKHRALTLDAPLARRVEIPNVGNFKTTWRMSDECKDLIHKVSIKCVGKKKAMYWRIIPYTKYEWTLIITFTRAPQTGIVEIQNWAGTEDHVQRRKLATVQHAA